MLLSLMNRRLPKITPLSLHDALPISAARGGHVQRRPVLRVPPETPGGNPPGARDRGHRTGLRVLALRPLRRAIPRSEEHTSELQSQFHIVCRLLLEKKNPNQPTTPRP